MRNQIEPFFTALKEGEELELSCYEYLESAAKEGSTGRPVPIGYRTYRELLTYMAKASRKRKLELKREIVFDFIVMIKDSEYRLSITGIEHINRILKMVSGLKSYVAARVLLRRYVDGHEEDADCMSVMRKVRKDRVELETHSGRIRVASEFPVEEKEARDLSRSMGPESASSIIFRYKQRVSLELGDDEGLRRGIDLTVVKQGRQVSSMEMAQERYEVELELFRSGPGKNKPKILEQFIDTAMEIFGVIDGTDIVMEIKQRDIVLDAYRKLVGSNRPSLEVRNAISMQLYHATNVVANKYGALDKAEGERYIGYVHSGHLYLISSNLHVRDTGVTVNEAWNNTVYDGEFMDDTRVFMAFDSLFLKGKDVRDIISLRERMDLINDFIKDTLPNGCILNKKKAEYDGDMTLDNLVEFYTAYTREHYRVLKYNIDHRPKSGVMVQKKLCLTPHGIHDSELFCYMNIIWSLYIEGLVPYILDGIILTPLQQRYTTKRGDAALQELKWKPEDKNSVDFYLRFVRDENTGKIMTLFNNVRDDQLKGRPYRIAYLYVGSRGRAGEEIPVEFMKEKKLHVVHLYLDNGEIRDMEGNPVRDGTVIEAYYRDDPTIDAMQRWTIMRTRWDKTESVMRYSRRFGNADETARNVWTSIQVPFRYNDISILAKLKSYERHMATLREKITQAMAIQMQRENTYYAKRTNLMKKQRQFHNWIKSIIMYPYFNPMYNTPNKMVVLDFGVGRGGDIEKYYYARVNTLVGIDPVAESIYSPIEGCMHKYKQQRRVRQNFPPMYFLHASATAPLTADAQRAALGNMSPENLAGIKRIFEGDGNRPPMRFDAINCQFALHYMFADEKRFGHFTDNINRTLRPGGWFIATCFDAELVMEAVGKEGKHTLTYIDETGSRRPLHEITKRFELTAEEQKKADKSGYGLGCAIDVYNASFMIEGAPQTEYLVDRRFIEREFMKRCNLEIVETGLFSTLYKTNREFFTKVAPWESNEPDYLLKVREFYNLDDEIDRISYDITRLNRYYIFRKGATIEEMQEVAQSRGPERKVPLKKTKEVPKQEEDSRKSRKPKIQLGGESTSDEDSDSEESSSSSDSEDEKSKKASRGLAKGKYARKHTHPTIAAEQAERKLEAAVRAEEEDSDTEDQDISDPEFQAEVDSEMEDIEGDLSIHEEDPDIRRVNKSERIAKSSASKKKKDQSKKSTKKSTNRRRT